MADNNNIKFDYPDIEQLHKNISSLFVNINTLVNNYSKVENIIPTEWKSMAASAYRDAYNSSIVPDVTSLTQSSDNFLSAMHSSYVGFNDTETEIKENAGLENPSEASIIINNFGKTDGEWNSLLKTNEDGKKYIEYTVVSGDTLGNIAGKMRTSLDNLLTNNPNITDANVIHPGDIIILTLNPEEGDENA